MLKGNVRMTSGIKHLDSNINYGVTSELKEKIIGQLANKNVHVVVELCKAAKISLSSYENITL